MKKTAYHQVDKECTEADSTSAASVSLSLSFMKYEANDILSDIKTAHKNFPEVPKK